MTIADTRRWFGLGLRKQHYASFLEGCAPVDFVEVISENFMVEGGRPKWTLEKVRQHYPVALHGVSMSIGSATGLSPTYLARLRCLVDRIEPVFVSDHLCWTGVDGFNSHDLLPLPYTEEALEVVCRNIEDAQDLLGRKLLLENPSSYVAFSHSTLTEWEFLAYVCARTACGVLLDVNNLFVSAANNGFDPVVYLHGLPAAQVRQIHLAGHDDSGEIKVDTHDRPVCPDVWNLYREACRLYPTAAIMIEWDDAIPPLAVLLEELGQARVLATTGAKTTEL